MLCCDRALSPFAPVDNAQLPPMLPAALLQHANHPDEPCHSLSCLREHCTQLRDAHPAHVELDSSLSTSPGSTTPTSTRSGTSPGYANDWAPRREVLVKKSDKPSRARSDRPVKQLAEAKIREERDTNVLQHDQRHPEAALNKAPAAVTSSIPTLSSARSSLLQRRQQRMRAPSTETPSASAAEQLA
jgi:hypothetical protein